MKPIQISADFDATADFILFPGDCQELLRQLPDQYVQLIVTSPPYNLGKQYENRIKMSEYLEQQRQVIEECVRVLSEDGSLCWQVGNYVDNGAIIPLDVVLYPIFSSLGLQLRNRIVWHFEHGLHTTKRFSGRYEIILWFTKGDDYIFNLNAVRVPQKYPSKKYFKGPKKGEYSGHPLGKNPGDVWIIPNVKANHVEKTIHPCQFPVELIERLLLALTNEGDWVLDPFIGVGTTAIAALMHRRRAIGAEILPEYRQIAEERIRLGEEGKLRVRPMERPVYDPNAPGVAVPPKLVRIGSRANQLPLFERVQQLTLDEEKV
jgi:adenine-specific DNA-methyltransferase